MTEEVGAITGELELQTNATPDGTVEAMVRYAGAQDFYTVSGSPPCAPFLSVPTTRSTAPPTSAF